MPPSRLYKYRSADGDLHLDTLVGDKIWAASPASLNDPFEASLLVDEERAITLDLLSMQRQEWVAVLSGLGALPAVEKFLAEIERFVEAAKSWGVYSLSQSCLDELSWAHYSDSHRGFCIEYDVDRLLDRDLKLQRLHHVFYEERPPDLEPARLLTLGETEAAKHLTRALIATKSKSWQHEQEWRLLTQRCGRFSYDFRAVRSIYFGYRMKQERRLEFMRRLQGRGTLYYVVAPVPRSYLLEAESIEDPFRSGPKYLHTQAPIDDGVPHIDSYLRDRGFEDLLRRATEIARWEPYCAKVIDAYEAGSRSTRDNPVFYVTCEDPSGMPWNMFLSRDQIEQAGGARLDAPSNPPDSADETRR